MLKAIFKLVGFAVTGLFMLLPGLRGFYLLHYNPEVAQRQAREYLLAISADVDAYADDHGGQYPTDLNALPSTAEARTGVGIGHVWDGILRAPLSKAWTNLRQVRAGALLDPWGAPWVLRVDQQHQTFRLESYGADRKIGGTGDDADLLLTKREGDTALSFLGDQPLW